MTRKGVESRIDNYIKKFIEARDFFMKSSNSYLKIENGKEINITFGVNTASDIKGDFVIGYGFGIRLNAIEEIWEKYRYILEEENQPPSYTMGFGRSAINHKSDKYPEHRFAKKGGEFITSEKDIHNYLDSVYKLGCLS